MIVYGKYIEDLVKIVKSQNGDIYNLTSTKEGYPLMDIAPPFDVYTVEEKQFDLAYANYLLTDDQVFVRMFMPILDMYMDRAVYILISDYAEEINESLIKFYQSRYGAIFMRINEISDYTDTIIEKASFTIQGVYNFDQDLERFKRLFPEAFAKYPVEIDDNDTI